MSLVKEKVESMFKKETNIRNFWLMSVLTFGLTLDSLESLLGMDCDSILNEYFKDSTSRNRVLSKWHNIYVSQNEAVAKFNAFLSRLYRAKQEGDVEEYRKTLREITDADALNLMNTRQSGDRISDEQVHIMLRYQLKYAISNGRVSEIFNINRGMYAQRVKRLFVLYPEYEFPYNELRDSFKESGYKYVRQKRGKK